MNEQSFEYRTGQTRPAKSSRGLIAFLLICIIFLCGLVRLLGLMNIHLLSRLQSDGQEAGVSFEEGGTLPADGEIPSLTVEGITLQEVTEVYQQIHDLPAGLYVVDAPEEGSVAPGDVLISCDNTPVTTLETLNTLYSQKKAGDTLWFTFHRQGQTFSLSIPIE